MILDHPASDPPASDPPAFDPPADGFASDGLASNRLASGLLASVCQSRLAPAAGLAGSLAADDHVPTHGLAANETVDDVRAACQPAEATGKPWIVSIQSARLGSDARLERRRIESRYCAGRGYRIDSVAASNLGCLEHFRDAGAPRMLAIDVALLDPAGVDALQRYRRWLPATDWLLTCDVSSEAVCALALRTQARGCIEWSMTDAQIARAFDAVLAGELWFSRPVLQTLYLSLLKAATPRGESPEPAEAQPGHEALTARETAVHDCMRQGMTNKQIAARLDISVNTVKKHLSRVYEKRGMHNGRQR